MDETSFVLEILKRGLAEPEDIEDCRKVVRELLARGEEKPLHEVLVERGVLTRGQVERLLGSRPEDGKGSSVPAPAPNFVPDPVEGDMFGPYRILKKLAEDGTGSIYRAQKQGTDGSCRLHILPPDYEAAELKRQGSSRVSLNHPNLLKTRAAGVIRGRTFVVTEDSDGIPASRVVQQRGPLPEKTALKIARQLAAALEVVHQAGLVHGAVVPKNVLVAPDDTVKLLPPTLPGLPVPGAGFLAPEVPEKTEPGSDLYGIGALLRHLLTGETPPFPSKFAAPVLRRTRELIRSLTASSPADRPASAAEVVRAIDALSAPASKTSPDAPHRPLSRAKAFTGSPPKAPGGSSRFQRRLQKKRFPVPLIAAAGVALLVAGSASWLALRDGRAGKPKTGMTPGRDAATPDETAVRLRGEVEGHLAVGAFGLAVRAIQQARTAVPPETARALEARVRTAAEEALRAKRKSLDRYVQEGRIDLARERLEAFRERLAAVPGIDRAIEREFERLSKLEAQARTESEGLELFRRLNASLAPFIERGEYEQAIRICRARLSGHDNPFFMKKVAERIRELEILQETVAELKTESGGPPKEKGLKVDPETLVRLARAAMDREDFVGASVLLSRALRILKRHPESIGMLARCRLALGKASEAQRHAHTALSLDPRQPDAHYVLGVLAQQEGRHREAIDHLTVTIAGLPGFGWAYVRRAQSLFVEGRLEEAVQDTIDAGKRNLPKEGLRLALRVRVRALAKLGRHDEALNACSALESIAPKDACILRGALYLDRGELLRARAEFERALEIDPDDREVKARLAALDRAIRNETKETSGPAARRGARKENRRSRAPAPQKKRKLIREKLLEYVHGLRERVDVLDNGDVRVTVVYDFNQEVQFQDFDFQSATRGRGYVDLESDRTDEYAVVLWKPPMRGNFTCHCVFRVLEVDPMHVAAIMLRTSDIGQAAKPGSGVGVTFVNTTAYDLAEWKMALVSTGPESKVLTDADNPELFRHYAKEDCALTLKLDGSELEATFGGGRKIRAKNLPPEPYYMRFLSAAAKVRLFRFEVQGYLDRDWVDELVGLRSGD